MSDLDARYGRRGRRRWVWTIVAIVALGAGVAFAAWVAFQPRPITAVLWGYQVLDDHRVRVTVDIRRPEPVAAQCTVYAQAEDHTTVGERTLAVPAEHGANTRVRAVIRTERRAVNGVLRGCRALG